MSKEEENLSLNWNALEHHKEIIPPGSSSACESRQGP